MYSLQTSLLLHPKSISVSPILHTSLDIDLNQHSVVGSTADNAKRLSLMLNPSGQLSHPVRMYSLQIPSLLHLESLHLSHPARVVGYRSGSALSCEIDHRSHKTSSAINIQPHWPALSPSQNVFPANIVTAPSGISLLLSRPVRVVGYRSGSALSTQSWDRLQITRNILGY